jgi:hypothetical protein
MRVNSPSPGSDTLQTLAPPVSGGASTVIGPVHASLEKIKPQKRKLNLGGAYSLRTRCLPVRKILSKILMI